MTKGLSFVTNSKVLVDLNRHSDIMEDAIDRIAVKEAKQSGEFMDWEEAKKKLNKKHGLNGVQNSNRKAAAQISGKRTKKRLR